jgi:hypothetical protein
LQWNRAGVPPLFQGGTLPFADELGMNIPPLASSTDPNTEKPLRAFSLYTSYVAEPIRLTLSFLSLLSKIPWR